MEVEGEAPPFVPAKSTGPRGRVIVTQGYESRPVAGWQEGGKGRDDDDDTPYACMGNGFTHNTRKPQSDCNRINFFFVSFFSFLV